MEEQKKTKRSYEDLERDNAILSQKLKAAYLKLEEADTTVIRLDFLFRVVGKYAVFDPSFVDMCTKEIKNILFGTDSESQNDE